METVLDQLAGKEQRGHEVRTTLDPGGQRAALAALNGRRGAVVAIEPATGRVRVMASTPSFDPNELRDARDTQALSDGSALNRTTLGQYPPGSTFKVVTAVAAIDSGKYTKDSQVDGKSPKTISGAPLNNFDNEQFGRIPLTEALTNSVNTVWAEVGVEVGRITMQDYMERFGFYERVAGRPARRGARPQRRPGRGPRGLRAAHEPARRRRPRGDRPGRPARHAAADGAGRHRRRQRRRAHDADAHRSDRRPRRPDGRADRAGVRERGHEGLHRARGRRHDGRRRPRGHRHRGRAGGRLGRGQDRHRRARHRSAGINTPWFIGFAPRDNPKIAIAVTLESERGQGGELAAPIAKQVLQELARDERR